MHSFFPSTPSSRAAGACEPRRHLDSSASGAMPEHLSHPGELTIEKQPSRRPPALTFPVLPCSSLTFLCLASIGRLGRRRHAERRRPNWIHALLHCLLSSHQSSPRIGRAGSRRCQILAWPPAERSSTLVPLTVDGGRNDGAMHVAAPMWCERSDRLAERLQGCSAPCLEQHAWVAAETSEELQQKAVIQ
ncbi:hypothetical protein ACQJBY_022864 [Aegilops geniculata]